MILKAKQTARYEHGLRYNDVDPHQRFESVIDAVYDCLDTGNLGDEIYGCCKSDPNIGMDLLDYEFYLTCWCSLRDLNNIPI
jgi:hypothetical protein